MKVMWLSLMAVGMLIACTQKAGSTKTEMIDGAAIYKKYCTLCHGADGKLGLNGSKDLTVSSLTEQERIVQVTEGKNTMTPFKGILSPEEIKAVVVYTLTLK